MHVDGAKLYIKDGRFSVDEEPKQYIFIPKRIDLDNVIIYGRNGNITLEAIRWLIKHNVQITILDWNGKLLTTMLPPESVQVKTKFAQYHSYSDNNLRLELAKKFIRAKFNRTKIVLEWLKLRYDQINDDFSSEEKLFEKTKSIPDIMMVEGRVAGFYWQELQKIFPEKYEFETREYQKKPRGAGDAINCMFNYGYAILESECLRAINSAGLDVHVGFMHEMCIGKNSLAYDLQEPFRFLIDLAVINLIENKSMEKRDFIRTENYNLRLRPTGARKLVSEIQNQFNKKVLYNGQMCSWSYILLTKTRELAHHLLGKKNKLDFEEPHHELQRLDNEGIRKKILDIPYSKWEKLGFSRGTLHYMKQNAKSDKPFTLNKHVIERLETIYLN